MNQYEFHPFADAFPIMTDQEHAALVADIKAHGLEECIRIYDGRILDGRNRYKACIELGLDPANFVIENDCLIVNDKEALAFVISKNLVRRHLNESQRAMVAAKLSGLQSGQRADQVQGLPIGRAASMLNIGERSVARARKVMEQGTPEQIAAIGRGEITVSKVVKQIHANCHDPKPPADAVTAEEVTDGNLETMSLDELATTIKSAIAACEQALIDEQEGVDGLIEVRSHFSNDQEFLSWLDENDLPHPGPKQAARVLTDLVGVRCWNKTKQDDTQILRAAIGIRADLSFPAEQMALGKPIK
jgi:hypothetical protein